MTHVFPPKLAVVVDPSALVVVIVVLLGTLEALNCEKRGSVMGVDLIYKIID